MREVEALRIREAQGKDAEDLIFLEKNCFSDAFSEKTIREMLEEEDYILLAAFTDKGSERTEKAVAYAGYRKVLDEGDIMHICVLPHYRKQGLGLMLMKALIRRAGEEGTDRIFLEVRTSNEAAIGLYEKTGYKKTGIRKDYYRGPREDALIMELAVRAGEDAARQQEKEERDA